MSSVTACTTVRCVRCTGTSCCAKRCRIMTSARGSRACVAHAVPGATPVWHTARLPGHRRCLPADACTRHRKSQPLQLCWLQCAAGAPNAQAQAVRVQLQTCAVRTADAPLHVAPCIPPESGSSLVSLPSERSQQHASAAPLPHHHVNVVSPLAQRLPNSAHVKLYEKQQSLANICMLHVLTNTFIAEAVNMFTCSRILSCQT